MMQEWVSMYWREMLLMLLALIGSHVGAYLLGEQNGQRFYWWRPLEGPKVREPEPEQQQPAEEVAYLEPDTVTIETVIVPLPADFEDTITTLEARALTAEAEAERQERLKQQHIKEKTKLREELHGYTITEPVKREGAPGYTVAVFLDGRHVHTAEGRTKEQAAKAADKWIDEDLL